MLLFLRSHSLRAITCIALVCGVVLSGCVSEKPRQSAVQATPSTAPADLRAGYYRVIPGDTLASIAAAFGRDAAQLASWNGLSTNATPSAGEILRVGPLATSQSANAASCKANAFLWPTKGPVLGRFGANGAKAMLIGGAAGDTIRAAASGRVVYTGDKIDGYGLLVIVKHSEQFITAYGFNQRVLVKEGNDVQKGQPIALMGGSTPAKPSLLFEVRKDRQPVDPLPYLSSCDS